MSKNAQNVVRLMIRPALPLPLPPLTRRATYDLDPTGRALIGWGGKSESHETHGEIYLKLLALDLDDPSAILSFAERYGALDGLAIQETLPGDWDVSDPLFDRSEIDEIEQTALRGIGRIKAAEDIHQEGLPEITALASFRFGARCFHDLVTVWQLLSRDPRLDRSIVTWQARPEFKRASLEIVAGFFGLALSALLPQVDVSIFPGRLPESVDENYYESLRLRKELKARAVVTDWQHELDTKLASRDELAPKETDPSPARLHEVCALELYNHITTGAVYKRCQNTNCRREFVRQEGRAIHGMSKHKGVLYCSHACAQAQASRDYRGRKRAKQTNPTRHT